MLSSTATEGANALASEYNNLRTDLINRELFLAQQAIINGNFDIWQRESTFTNPSSASFTADRFKVVYVNTGTLPTTIVHSRQALTPGDVAYAFYEYRIAPNGAGAGFGVSDIYSIQQLIEYGTRYLCGLSKQITISFKAKSNIGSKKLGVGAVQNYGTGGSPSSEEILSGGTVTLTSSWVSYSVTITTNTLVGKTFGTNNDDVLKAVFAIMWGSTTGSSYGFGSAETFVGSGNIEITQVQVNAGNTAFGFWPKSFQEELNLCKRFYQKSYAYGVFPGAATSSGEIINSFGALSSGIHLARVGLPIQIRTNSPTITVYDRLGASGKIETFDASLAVTSGVTPTQLPTDFTENSFDVWHSANVSGIGFQYTVDAEL